MKVVLKSGFSIPKDKSNGKGNIGFQGLTLWLSISPDLAA